MLYLMLFYFFLSFTVILLSLLIYPSWEVSVLIIVILRWFWYMYELLSEWKNISTRQYGFFVFFVILLWASIALCTMWRHTALISYGQDTILEDNKVRREWSSWGSVLLSGAIIDFRRNNAVVLNSWWVHYVVRDFPNVSDYKIWSQLLVSGRESSPDSDSHNSIRIYFWSSDHSSDRLPLIFQQWFDYDMWRTMKGYRSDIYATSVIHLGEASLWFLDRQKNAIRDSLKNFSDSQSVNALILWMLIWDVSWMSAEQYDTFIQSGLIHIVAVSGGNMVLLVVVLRWLLFWLPYYPRLWATMVLMSIYALVCGLDSSVFRALMMWSLTLLALFAWRSISIYRSIMIAWCVILFYSPYSLLYDVWFLLSFWALLSIVILTRRFPRPQSSILGGMIYEYFWVTLAANIWVLPVLILFMWEMNIFWFLGNLIVLPLVVWIMIWWALYIWVMDFWLWDIVAYAWKSMLLVVQWVADYSSLFHLTISTTTVSAKLRIILIYICLRLFLWLVAGRFWYSYIPHIQKQK